PRPGRTGAPRRGGRTPTRRRSPRPRPGGRNLGETPRRAPPLPARPRKEETRRTVDGPGPKSISRRHNRSRVSGDGELSGPRVEEERDHLRAFQQRGDEDVLLVAVGPAALRISLLPWYSSHPVRPATQDAPGQRPRVLALVEDDVAVHDHRVDPARIAVRIVVGAALADGGRVEDRQVRPGPLAHDAAIRETERGGGSARHLPDRLLERQQAKLARVVAEHPRE